MPQPGTTCFWCNVDPRKEMPNGISPHSTWCPQYHSPPSVKKIVSFFEQLTEEQKKAALEYDGPENHGGPAYKSS